MISFGAILFFHFCFSNSFDKLSRVDFNDNSSNYYKTRVLKTKQINSRSSINHFAFHLANPINVFFRNIVLKYLSKNKNFLENYLGKIYKS